VCVPRRQDSTKRRVVSRPVVSVRNRLGQMLTAWGCFSIGQSVSCPNDTEMTRLAADVIPISECDSHYLTNSCQSTGTEELAHLITDNWKLITEIMV